MAQLLPDRVLIGEGRGQRRVSLDEYLALPLPQRVRMLLGKELTFLSGEQVVPPEAALKAISGMRRSSTSAES